MSDVLGRDCDGRELRVGDRLVVAHGHQHIGRELNVIGPATDGGGGFTVDSAAPNPIHPYFKISPQSEWRVRKINSARDLFDK